MKCRFSYFTHMKLCLKEYLVEIYERSGSVWKPYIADMFKFSFTWWVLMLWKQCPMTTKYNMQHLCIFNVIFSFDKQNLLPIFYVRICTQRGSRFLMFMVSAVFQFKVEYRKLGYISLYYQADIYLAFWLLFPF